MADLAEIGFYFEPGCPGIDWESRATAALVSPAWLERERHVVEASRAALPPLDAHLWVATSGSSALVPGQIRWVALPKAAFLASARAVNAHLGSHRADTWAHALPVFHVGGLGILARAWLSGARVVPAVSGRWDARRFNQCVTQSRATLAALVPSQVHDLVGARLRAPASLRAVVVGGARLDPELCGDARGLGWPCLPSYGLTETCSQVATAPLDSALSPVCDPPLAVLAHAEIRGSADHRLQVRGDSLLSCYAEMTGAGMQAWDPKQDGWFDTEDLGRVTAAGVEVLGRASDSVKVLGELVSIQRVEAVAARWAAAEPLLAGARADLAVAAVPDGRLGHEIVLALAVADRARLQPAIGEPLQASLERFCREALRPYERVRRIAWVEAIPRTPLGKCQRRLLADQVTLEAPPQG